MRNLHNATHLATAALNRLSESSAAADGISVTDAADAAQVSHGLQLQSLWMIPTASLQLHSLWITPAAAVS